MESSSLPPNATTEEVEKPHPSWLRSKWPEVAFFGGLTGFSMLLGFGATVAASKKSDPEHFDKGFTPEPEKLAKARHAAQLHESGVSLALRALGRATLYSVGGVSLFCFTVWKLSGASNFEEFRQKMGTTLPRVSKNNPPTSKVEFESLGELFQYIIDEDRKTKSNSTISTVVDAKEQSNR